MEVKTKNKIDFSTEILKALKSMAKAYLLILVVGIPISIIFPSLATWVLVFGVLYLLFILLKPSDDEVVISSNKVMYLSREDEELLILYDSNNDSMNPANVSSPWWINREEW